MSFLTLSIGSYDHTVRLFDSRIDNCVLTVDHGAPVESVLMFPTGGMFVSAGKISYHYVKAKWFYLLLYLHLNTFYCHPTISFVYFMLLNLYIDTLPLTTRKMVLLCEIVLSESKGILSIKDHI